MGLGVSPSFAGEERNGGSTFGAKRQKRGKRVQNKSSPLYRSRLGLGNDALRVKKSRPSDLAVGSSLRATQTGGWVAGNEL